MKITFTVHLFRFWSVLEWKPTTSVKNTDCQNLSLKTNNSQQNVKSGLFLHRAHYIGQSLGLDLVFPFPQRPPKSPVIDLGMLPVLHMVIYEVPVWSYLLYALEYISMSSCSSNLHCLLVCSLFELHGLGTLPLSSHVRTNLSQENTLWVILACC